MIVLPSSAVEWLYYSQVSDDCVVTKCWMSVLSPSVRLLYCLLPHGVCDTAVYFRTSWCTRAPSRAMWAVFTSMKSWTRRRSTEVYVTTHRLSRTESWSSLHSNNPCTAVSVYVSQSNHCTAVSIYVHQSKICPAVSMYISQRYVEQCVQQTCHGHFLQ